MQHTTVLLVRHGESEGNVSGYWQGQIDTPLTSSGQQQACLVAERVHREYNGTLGALISSDLQRALQTAQAIADITGLLTEVDPRWRERGLGAWEGLTTEQIAEQFPGEWQDFEDFKDAAYGGGESRADVQRRVDAALHDCLERYAGKFICIVTHGGPIRCVLSNQMGLTWRESLELMPANANTALTLIEFHGDRAEVILRMDAGHLELESLNPTTHP